MNGRNLSEAIRKGKVLIQKYRWVLLVLLAGVVLMLWPEGGSSTAAAAAADASDGSGEVAELETRIGDTLSKIDGAGKVTVVLTVREGARHVWATDTTEDTGENGTQQSSQTVVVDGDSGEEPIQVQEIYPTFQGAVVVCGGGDDPAVRLLITQAVSSLTGLSSGRITVCKGK